MPRSKSKKLPSFRSIDALVRFFEAHDMGEYAGQMPETKFDVAIKKRRFLIAIDGKLMNKTEIAKSKKLPAERLINAWLEEKVSGTGSSIDPDRT